MTQTYLGWGKQMCTEFQLRTAYEEVTWTIKMILKWILQK